MRLPVVVVILVAAATAPAADPIPPRTVTIPRPVGTLGEAAAEAGKQAGVTVVVDGAALAASACPATFDQVPFWAALEDLAQRTDARVIVRGAGNREVALVPRGAAREVSAVSGPFRVVAWQIEARDVFATAGPVYDLQLAAQWEPRVQVFFVSGVPHVGKATDDRGTVLTAGRVSVREQPTGAQYVMAPARLGGLTRASRTIATLAGSFTVVAAERMLTFRFDDLTAPRPAPADAGVTAALREFRKDDDVWEATVELAYPGPPPRFESHEEQGGVVWLTRNRMQLIPPGGGKAFAPSSSQILEAGKRVVAVYRFKEDPAAGLTNPAGKGWALVYDTPAPLVEFDVPFTLTGIPLP